MNFIIFMGKIKFCRWLSQNFDPFYTLLSLKIPSKIMIRWYYCKIQNRHLFQKRAFYYFSIIFIVFFFLLRFVPRGAVPKERSVIPPEDTEREVECGRDGCQYKHHECWKYQQSSCKYICTERRARVRALHCTWCGQHSQVIPGRPSWTTSHRETLLCLLPSRRCVL